MSPRHDFVSSIFHDLSQPLTALQCSLELALARDHTIEEFRTSVEAALHNAQRLRQRLLFLRALRDAEEPGNTSMPLGLDRLLQQLREDMLPLFESAGRSLEMTCEPVKVPANEAKLMRGFFYLLESVFRGFPQSRTLRIRGMRRDRNHVEVCIEGCVIRADAGWSNDCLDPEWTAETEIARRTFCAIGGDLIWKPSSDLSGAWIVRLPCVG